MCTQFFASPKLQTSLGSWFYKHWVPPGPKSNAITGVICCQNSRDTTLVSCFVNSRHKRNALVLEDEPPSRGFREGVSRPALVGLVRTRAKSKRRFSVLLVT